MTDMIPGTAVLKCPVDGCSWEHTEPASNVPLATLANVFGFGVMTAIAANQRAQRLEDAVRRHFEGHKVEDFVQTIVRLQQVGQEPAAAIAAMSEQPSAIEADLRTGLWESERRRRIAAVVAGRHQDRLAAYRTTAPVDLVKAGFEAVLAALNGTTDPDRLGLAGDPLFVEQVRAIVAGTSGEAGRG